MNEADKYAFEQIKQQYDMPFLQIGMNTIVKKNAVKVAATLNTKIGFAYESLVCWLTLGILLLPINAGH